MSNDKLVLPVGVETRDAETGELLSKETLDFKILPPTPGSCSVCGVPHVEGQPHNAQSIFYQYRFYGAYGRWPTWADAIAHCTENVKQVWTEQIKTFNAWTEPAEGIAPIAEPYKIQE